MAGTEISLVNLIDAYTQWSVSQYGFEIDNLFREDSVCQYVVAHGSDFEVSDLSRDERFMDMFYVKDAPRLRYYYGPPLKTSAGNSIGALCVLDKEARQLAPEKVELLRIIAREVVSRLETIKAIESLKERVRDLSSSRKRVAHDIRGPLSGIVGLAEIAKEQGKDNRLDEVLEYIALIDKSGRSLRELAEEILTAEDTGNRAPEGLSDSELTQLALKEKLEKLYIPQARSKGVQFSVLTDWRSEFIPFRRNRLL